MANEIIVLALSISLAVNLSMLFHWLRLWPRFTFWIWGNYRYKCCQVGCDKYPAFDILAVRSDGIAGPCPYSDDTMACEEHVGTLLGYQVDAERPREIYWEVQRR